MIAFRVRFDDLHDQQLSDIAESIGVSKAEVCR